MSFQLNGNVIAVVSTTAPALLNRRSNSSGIVVPIPQAFAGIAYFYPVVDNGSAPDATEMLKGIQRVAGQEFDGLFKGDVELYHMVSAGTMTATGFEVVEVA